VTRVAAQRDDRVVGVPARAAVDGGQRRLTPVADPGDGLRIAPDAVRGGTGYPVEGDRHLAARVRAGYTRGGGQPAGQGDLRALLFESWLGPAGRFGGLTSLKCLQAGRPPAVAAFAWVRFTPVSTAAPTATARTLIQVRRRMRPLDHTHRRW